MQLKKLCAICSAVLVAFSCSLVPAVISPAYALATSDWFATSYCWMIEPDVYSEPITIPGSGGIYGSFTPTSSSVHLKFKTGTYEPVNHSRTLMIVIGVGGATVSYSTSGSTFPVASVDYQSSTSDTTFDSDGCRYKWRNGVSGGHSLSFMWAVNVPANSTSLSFQLPLTFNTSDTSHQYKVFSNSSYILDTNNPDVVDIVAQILQQLQSVNAELDTQTTIMRAINSYLSNVDSNVTSIYELLHEALAQESSEIDSKSQAVADSIMQQDNAEQFWNDKNQENFDALDLNNFSFSTGVVTALGTVGNLFTSIWNSLGDTVVIFTFPLMLGITLVAIGRVSRHDGKGKKGKGGDSE